MQVFILGVVCLAFYLIVRVLSTGASWFSNARYRGYRHISTRFRGKYEHRGMAEPPTVSFAYHGASIRVGLAPHIQGQPVVPRTRVVARFGKGLPFRLELAPVLRPAPPQAPKGTRIVRIGQPNFDREFVVQANDPDMAGAFLATPVQGALAFLQRMGPPGGMLISVNPERLLVQVDRNLGPYPEALEAMVRHALVILDGLVSGVTSRMSAGVTIVDESNSPESISTEAPICKVCGEPIEGPRVLCTLCKTPHHLDCWEYVGACSIFGCSSKTSARG